MDFDRFFKFSQLLLRDEFVLSYSGYVSEDILLAVGDTLRERLEDHARDGAQIRNVFSIFVELMQNIIRYGVEGPQPGPADGEKPSFGIVMVSENDGHMDVIAGNYVASPDVPRAAEAVPRPELQGCQPWAHRDRPQIDGPHRMSDDTDAGRSEFLHDQGNRIGAENDRITA